MNPFVATTLACMIALAGVPASANAQTSAGSSPSALSALEGSARDSGDRAQREHLNFVTGHNPPYSNSKHTGIADQLLIEAFRRADIDLSIRKVPTARAGSLVDSGIEDGCGPRIAEFSERFPNLVRIDEPVITFDMVAFTKLPDIENFQWNDLAGKTVGHVFGAIMLDRQVQENAETSLRLSNPRQVFRLLKQDRIDIAIAERRTAQELIKSLNLQNVRALSPALESRLLYFFVNRDHAHLAPRIAEGLRAAKADGTFAKILARSPEPFQPGF